MHKERPLRALRRRDGWRLAGELAACHLGAFAAWPSAARAVTLWNPMLGLQVFGYGISLVAVSVVVLLWRREAASGSAERA